MVAACWVVRPMHAAEAFSRIPTTPPRFSFRGGHPERTMNPEIEKELAALGDLRKRMLAEFAKVIVGQRDVLDELLITVFSGGHNLLEGVPGLAKTLMINTLARLLSLHFKRIQ